MVKLSAFFKFFSRKRVWLWLGLAAIASLLLWQLKARIYIGPPPVITYTCPANKSVLHSLVAQYSAEFIKNDAADIVTVIDGYAKTDDKQWQYRVNGQPSPVGPRVYVCGGGEVITWELR